MRRGVRAKSIEVQLQFVVHTQESKSREIVREMSGLASFGQVVPAIVGMMGCSFGVFYCVRNLKVSEKKRKKEKTIIIVREKNQDKTLAFSDDPRPSGWVSSGTAGTAAGDTAIARTSFI